MSVVTRELMGQVIHGVKQAGSGTVLSPLLGQSMDKLRWVWYIIHIRKNVLLPDATAAGSLPLMIPLCPSSGEAPYRPPTSFFTTSCRTS